MVWEIKKRGKGEAWKERGEGEGKMWREERSKLKGWEKGN